MQLGPNHERRGVSEVLATVILIAITLVAGVAIAGFAFGLFGSLSKAAVVQVTGVTCSIGGSAAPSGFIANNGHKTCFISLSNSGAIPGSVLGCALYGAAGTLLDMTASPSPSGVEVPAGSTSGVECYLDSAGGASGNGVSGSLTLSNGVTLPVSGDWAP